MGPIVRGTKLTPDRYFKVEAPEHEDVLVLPVHFLPSIRREEVRLMILQANPEATKTEDVKEALFRLAENIDLVVELDRTSPARLGRAISCSRYATRVYTARAETDNTQT